MNSDSIPVDLVTEILSRLPQKSITRFHSVSKLWASILRCPYFTELFLIMSSAKPRLLFAIGKKGVWSFFSSHQHQNPYEKSSPSLVVTAKFHMKFPPENMKIDPDHNRRVACGYASGLIYFYSMWIKEEDNYGVNVICNPNTGQYVTLPYLLRYRKSYSCFGFDPIDKHFKVFYLAYPRCSDEHKIIILGTGEMRWRTIECPLPHDPLSKEIRINGVLYYLGRVRSGDENIDFVIVCFEVRSEKFKFIYLPKFFTLINYKGKLCGVQNEVNGKDDDAAMELRMWVLEDAEKEEWSKYAYTFRDDKFIFDAYIDVVGVTSMGEIILSMGYYVSKEPFNVFYFNPEKNTVQRVEIQGFGEYYNEAFPRHRVLTFANHVEDLKVNDPKLLNSSIYASYVKREDKDEESREGEENE